MNRGIHQTDFKTWRNFKKFRLLLILAHISHISLWSNFCRAIIFQRFTFDRPSQNWWVEKHIFLSNVLKNTLKIFGFDSLAFFYTVVDQQVIRGVCLLALVTWNACQSHDDVNWIFWSKVQNKFFLDRIEPQFTSNCSQYHEYSLIILIRLV